MLIGCDDLKVDAKRDLDNVLKQSCFNLKQSSLKLLLGPLDAFLAKATAFVGGEIPLSYSSASAVAVHLDGHGALHNSNNNNSNNNNNRNSNNNSNNNSELLAASAVHTLKQQAFLRPERIREMLEAVQVAVAESGPDLRKIMKVSKENTFTPTSSSINIVCFELI